MPFTSLIFCQRISFIDVCNFECNYLDNALANAHWFLTLFCLMYHCMLQLHYDSVTNFHLVIFLLLSCSFTESIGEKAFEVKISQEDGGRARIYAQVLDLQDGSYSVRFRPFESYSTLRINLLHEGNHVGKSPYYLKGNCAHAEKTGWSGALS